MKTCEENDLGVHDRTKGMKFLMNLHDLKGKLNNRGGSKTGYVRSLIRFFKTNCCVFSPDVFYIFHLFSKFRRNFEFSHWFRLDFDFR